MTLPRPEGYSRSTLAAAIVAVVLGIFGLAAGADAQPPPRVPRIGILFFGTYPDPGVEDFRQALRELGYVEGRVRVEYRFAEGRPERLPPLAAELARLDLDVIFALGTDVAAAAKAATTRVPIVMVSSGDPVRAGLVVSLARPGGNVTGVTMLASDLAARRLELLREAAPRATRIGVLWNPEHPDAEFSETQRASRASPVRLESLEAWSFEQLESALETARKARIEALVVVPSRLTFLYRQRIAEFALRQRLPAIAGWNEFAEAGGLLAYGPNLRSTVRQAAVYVQRILGGAKPADLPVEPPARIELMVNLKTAQALGLTLPQSLLVRADALIK